MTYTIDCTGIRSSGELHQVLRETLSFPDWYGSNLDALHDCLCAIGDESTLVLDNFLGLDTFARGFLQVFSDAAQENPNLTIRIS